MKPPTRALLLALVSIAVTTSAQAQWRAQGTAMCVADDDQASARIVPGGPGHAILVWRDHRGSSHDVFAQRVDTTGVIRWALDGVALCAHASDQHDLAVVSDGQGGAIIAWSDDRAGPDDIYAQRVDSTGVPLWTTDGVPVCSTAASQGMSVITSDGAGGAIVAWVDARNGNPDIYAQRVNSAGVPQWTLNGVAVCTAIEEQAAAVIAPSGTGSAIIGWHDGRSGPYHIYAQRVTAAGLPLWQADGVALCLAANGQYNPSIVADAAGGAIVAWTDYRVLDSDVYAQRVNSSGATQWATDGVAVCAAGGFSFNPKVVGDGAGGAIVAWDDFRASDYDIFAQRIGPTGTSQWAANGVAVCAAVGGKGFANLVSDGAGGVIVAWHDHRSSSADIFAQKLNAAGTPQWPTNGIVFCSDPTDQLFPAIVGDGAGGAIVAWSDLRSGTGSDIYALGVTSDGGLPPTSVLPGNPRVVDLSAVSPNPTRGMASAFLVLADRAPVHASVLDVSGRVMAELAGGQTHEPGRHRLTWSGRAPSGVEAPAGIYFLAVSVQGATRTRKLVLTR